MPYQVEWSTVCAHYHFTNTPEGGLAQLFNRFVIAPMYKCENVSNGPCNFG